MMNGWREAIREISGEREGANKPSMEDIERLVGQYVEWELEAREHGLKDDATNEAADLARAALLAAIREYGRE